MAQRLTYRRRHCYATQSNKTRKVKTPGVAASLALSVGVCCCRNRLVLDFFEIIEKHWGQQNHRLAGSSI